MPDDPQFAAMQFATMVARVKDRANLPDIASKYKVDSKARGREFSAFCPFHDERTASFTMYRKGGDWRYHCFGCGRGGDAIGFVMEIENIGFRDAVNRMAADAGIDDREPPSARRRREARAARRAASAVEYERKRNARRHGFARQIWRSSGRASCSAVTTYLRISRGVPLEIEIPPSIRAINADDLQRIEIGQGWTKTDEHRAMVGGVQDVTGKLVAVHLTFINPDGHGRPDIKTQKRMIGPVWGGAVRFGPVAGHIYIAEGIETALSVLAAIEAAEMPGSVWAALSLGNIAGKGVGKGARRARSDPRRDKKGHWRLPSDVPDMDSPGLILPDECESITICADGDGKDPPAADALLRRAEARWRAQGLRVSVAKPPAGMDFNDLLLKGLEYGP